MKTYSRRDFLKLGGLALAGLAFTSFLPEFTQFEDMDLVRVAKDPVSVYQKASDKSAIVHTWVRDNLVHVYESIQVPTNGNTSLWYRVFGGYMNAGRLQQVRVQYNVPLSNLPTPKVLSEVTVPYTQPYIYNKLNGWSVHPTYYHLYYSCTQWITSIETGPDGKAWYKVQDEADKNSYYYVPTEHLRPIFPNEYTPLSANVPIGQKRIEVDLTRQALTCYESDKIVFATQVSTGQGALLATPVGEHNIMVKLPSRNMSTTSPLADDIIPLVGDPWTSFFTAKGHAFHGTYWHNNFGYTMSHGCVNMRNADALWLFRWCQPTADFEHIRLATLDNVPGYGTAVNIHY